MTKSEETKEKIRLIKKFLLKGYNFTRAEKEINKLDLKFKTSFRTFLKINADSFKNIGWRLKDDIHRNDY